MQTEEQPPKPTKWERLGIEPPEVTNHGVTPDDIRAQMQPAKCWNWRLEGNTLHCDTDLGPMTQTISTDYILRGTDEKGLPILVKVL